MAIEIESLVERIKNKVAKSLRMKKFKKSPYVKMDKSSSVKVEIRSHQARKIINKTLQAADRPGKISSLS